MPRRWFLLLLIPLLIGLACNLPREIAPPSADATDDPREEGLPSGERIKTEVTEPPAN